MACGLGGDGDGDGGVVSLLLSFIIEEGLVVRSEPRVVVVLCLIVVVVGRVVTVDKVTGDLLTENDGEEDCGMTKAVA